MPTSPYLVTLRLFQPTKAQPSGGVQIVANQGDSPGPLTIEVPGITVGVSGMTPRFGDAQFWGYEQFGYPAGTYEATIRDASGLGLPDLKVTFTLALPSGCTDPLATNYDELAGNDDGSCAYSPPPAPGPFFAVPLLQSLRFVVRTGGPLGVDATLFCEQPRPGQQVRPAYYQLVENGDQVRVQVLTSYAAVSATLRRHGGSQVGTSIALQQVLTLEGSAAPLGVVLSEDKPTGLTRLTPAVGLGLPASLQQAARLTLTGGATGTYRIKEARLGTVASPADSLLLNRPWQAPGAGSITANWQLAGPGYNVFEADVPVAVLAAGYYQVQLRATRVGWADAVADSEPISVRASWPKSLAVDFRNADNCFGAVFSTGLTPRVRVTATAFRQKPGGTSSAYRDSAGQLTVLSSTAQRLLQFETYLQPTWMHEKLALACRLDYLAVGGVRCQTDQAYEPADERAYPLSGGRVSLEQVAWLGGASGNGDDAGVVETVPENALQLRESNYLLLRDFNS